MKFRTLFLLFITVIANYSKAQIITTIAGNGYLGDDGPATAAGFNGMWYGCTDTSGNVYFTDAGHNRIRKIDAATGIITTIAGNGRKGFSGDGGAATKASINAPWDVFVAVSGNIYIADFGNYRIRKIDHNTGIISTVAGTGFIGYTGDGGPSIAAQIAPYRLCVDSDENIYFTDKDTNYVVRKIDGVSGIISTIAGTGIESSGGTSGDGGPALMASIGYECGICVDASKNIYLSDNGLNRVRKIDATTGVINTIAGGGNSTNDGILAIQSTLSTPVFSVSVDGANNIYIGSRKYCRKIDASTGIINTVVSTMTNSSSGFSGDGGPATAAKIFGRGAFVDKKGNIYIPDFNNYRIRKVDVDNGIINTIAGNGMGGMFTGDNGLAINASLNYPSSVCIDRFSNIIIADAANNRIRKIDASTGIISTVAGSGIAGFPVDGAIALEASITVNRVKTDSSGNIYFLANNGKLYKISTATGIINTVTGGGSLTGEGIPANQAAISISDFCFDMPGNIYVTDGSTYRVKKINISDGLIYTIAGTVLATGTYSGDGGPAMSASFGSPYAICSDDSNNIYIADNNFGVVRKINVATGIITTVAGNGTRAAVSAGDGGPAVAASLSAYYPYILTDNLGNLCIQDIYNIRKVTRSTGIISTIAGNGIQGFSGDGGDPVNAQLYGQNSIFAFNKSGTMLYIADRGNDRIRKISFNTTSLCPPSGSKALTSTIIGSSYQWQINNGTGFTNISDNANYTGTSTGTIQLNNIPSSWTGYEFRCLVDGNYSEAFTLKFLDQWTGSVNTVWENAGNWSCSGLPDANTDVVINAGSTIVINSNVTVRSLQVSPGANIIVSPGSNLTVLH